ncbi:FAD-dependent oxidoreductase [Fontivita pretiosa]|uniref:FAD-dependent oxidoreductase n=1 Tax=Fontivita pretiosa TaxID=2989684 RepID=UPI003D1727A8
MWRKQHTQRVLVAALVCMIIQGWSGLVLGQQMIQEPPRSTPVLYEADVVVVGGGLSGVGAALGAARSGAKTVLIERTGYLGGWIRGTGLGNVVAIQGWRPALTEGVLLDITRKMVELRAEGYPDVDTVLNTGHLLVTNHEMMPHAFQSLVVESGVKIFYFSTYSTSIVRDGHIEAVIIETPVGRGAIRGKVYIDCTGLATVAAESGAPVKRAEAFMGLAAWMGGVDVARFQSYEASLPKEPDPQMKSWLEAKLGHKIGRFSSDGSGDMDYPWDDWLERNANVLGPAFRQAVDSGQMPLYYTVGKKGKVSFIEGLKVIQFEVAGGIARPRTYVVGVDPTNIEEVSEAHIKSSQYLFKLAEFLNRHVPGFEKAQITRLAEMTLNRAGRSIVNDADPANEDINSHVAHDDVIAILQRGKDRGAYEVPYRAMVAEKIDNLLAVGKSSSGGIKFRTHMLSVIMGQAAGTAAAIAVQDGVLPRDVNIRKVQAELRKAGVPLPQK